MRIDVIDNLLYINDANSNLKMRHLSQLNYWGFKKKSADNLYFDDDIEIMLPKLISYFDKEKLNYALSQSSNNLLQQIIKVENQFKILLNVGRKLKNGEYEQDEFTKHIKFLKGNITRKLKEHQIKASYHFWLIGNGANFSVPGSGKTTVVLTVYERLRLLKKVNTIFVVGPPACFGPWKDEFEQVLGRKADYIILAGGDKLHRKSEYFRRENISELYLTTFQTLLNDQQDVITFLSCKKVKALLVIDEAHYIKQVNGNWASAALNIAKHAECRSVLTGTPIPKSYTDLYNLFDFLWPDNNPISLYEKTKLEILEKSKNFKEAKEILENKVGPLFYRVRKNDLGLAAQIFKDPEIIVMNPHERKIYDAIYNKIKHYAIDDYLKNIDLVEKLRRGRMVRLRQCLSFSYLLSTVIEKYNESLISYDSELEYIIYNYDKIEMPGKLVRLLELICNFQKRQEKVVIWSNFIGTINLIEKYLRKDGIRCKKIIGETPVERTAISEEETREKIRNEFIDPKSGLDVLIANPAACAESISLHKTCFNAIYYDLSYNCAQFLQSLDRIHRVGGSEDKEAFYYFLQYENTIDSDIFENIKEKAQRMYDIIEEDYNIYSLDMFEDSDELAAYERLFLKS